MRTGIVQRTTSKDVKTRYGMKKTYSVQVDGTWYSCGFTDPRCSVGEEIAFESTSGPYGEEISKGTLIRTGAKTTPEVRESTVPTPVGSAGTHGSAPKSTGLTGRDRPFPIPPLHGDRAIVRQNALGHAVRLLSASPVYNADGATDHEATVHKAIEMARKFEAYACGDLDREMAEAIVKKAAKKSTEAAIKLEVGE